MAQHNQSLLNTSRRLFLQAGALLAVSPSLCANTRSGIDDVFVSAVRDDNAGFGVGWIDRSSGQLPSGFRGHGAAVHPLQPSIALMFARRPGMRAIEVDLLKGRVVREFGCDKNRHFFGHGCFSADGNTLFTTENDLLSNQGRIVIRDFASYQVLGEYPSYGIGPHQMMLMPDQRTLVVANGGLLTRPERGREVLNADSMDSSLVYIDSQTGELLEQVRVAESKASIRHLDVAGDGTVAFAMQLQREAAGHPDTVPLTAYHRRGGEPVLFEQPSKVIRQLQDYVGSVAISNLSQIAGFTSPRGDLAVFWHIPSNELVGYHRMPDVCGLAVSSDQSTFVLTSSVGQVRFLNAATLEESHNLRRTEPGLHWDNHLFTTDVSGSKA